MKQLLEVSDLHIAFSVDQGLVEYVDGVSFSVGAGETLCIVGESGCGKSVTSLSVMNLLAKNGRVTGGTVRLDGKDLSGLDEKGWNRLRGAEMAMVFQDAMSSLNPVFTVGNQLTEAIRLHLGMNKQEAREHAAHLLERVGIPHGTAMLKKYPYMLSGGTRQRVMIAMALACRPKLLIADEPTTALDVTVQAQIVALLKELQKELNMALVLITHDIGLVAEMADRVAVMYAGQIVEEAEVFSLFEHPAHPYTKALLRSVPSPFAYENKALESIPGRVPAYYQEIEGCRFQGRCPLAAKQCEASQGMLEVAPGHRARCWRAARDTKAEKEAG